MLNRVAVVALGAALASCGTMAEKATGWSWHEEDTELYSAVFSPDGQEIALVRKRHLPDGHEAESFSEEELKARYARIDKDQRYSDPQVVVVKISTGAVEPIDWGWSPAFSPDGAKIAYAYQKNPISRFRMVAEKFAGNDIRLFDRATKTQRTVASPKKGYLTDPLFSPDGRVLAYSLGDAVNGAWGGSVGVGRVEVAGKNQKTLYDAQKSHGLLHLVNEKVFKGEQVLALRSTPATGGMYLADTYVVDLIDTGPPVKTVYSWGQRALGLGTPFGFTVTTAGQLLVFEERWMPIEYANGVREFSETLKTDMGLIAPNGTLTVSQSPDGLAIHDVATGVEKRNVKLKGKPQSISWSTDSSRLAVIVTKYSDEYDEIFGHDELLVVNLKP